jgi:redox-sensitive bicupin YhaK (pirin superfamily)
MTTIRKSNERGHADHGWLNSYHTFSFAGYFDRKHMGFRSLRVINEDRVAPGAGFGAHGHDNMEIISYVLSGALAHKDSMGHVETLRPGELQRMSAGTGITHSEYNGSEKEPVHFLQIWLQPAQANVTPSYEQVLLREEEKAGKLVLVAAPKDGKMTINQDAKVWIGRPEPGKAIDYTLAPKRGAWVHVIKGDATVNGQPLATGDAAAITEEEKVSLTAQSPNTEVLLFDLA